MKEVADITIITLTLGRESLTNLITDIEAQICQPKQWIIVADGEIPDAVKTSLPSFANIVNSDNDRPLYLPRCISAINSIETNYVTFMDDDNRFTPGHLINLINGLKDHPAVATSRLYVNDKYEVQANEHPKSELVDTNNLALQTDFLKDALQFSTNNPDEPWMDRHLQAYLLARCIVVYRIPIPTVRYKINPKTSYANSTGTIFETLDGTVFSMQT